jgi:CheY-like chemotaxis protein
VYGFVKQSGGHVQLDSELQVGTTITMYLPRSHRAPKVHAERASPLEVKAGATGTVLVVEDNEAVRFHSVYLLNELGYQVIEAIDASTALVALRNSPHVSLMFTDIGLGGGADGYQLAQQAREIKPDLKFLYTTGFTQDRRFEEDLSLLRKPFTFAELAAKLHDVMV